MSPRTLGASIPSSSSCETNINGSVVTCVVNSKDTGLLRSVRVKEDSTSGGEGNSGNFWRRCGGVYPILLKKTDLLTPAFALPK